MKYKVDVTYTACYEIEIEESKYGEIEVERIALRDFHDLGRKLKTESIQVDHIDYIKEIEGDD